MSSLLIEFLSFFINLSIYNRWMMVTDNICADWRIESSWSSTFSIWHCQLVVVATPRLTSLKCQPLFSIFHLITNCLWQWIPFMLKCRKLDYKKCILRPDNWLTNCDQSSKYKIICNNISLQSVAASKECIIPNLLSSGILSIRNNKKHRDPAYMFALTLESLPSWKSVQKEFIENCLRLTLSRLIWINQLNCFDSCTSCWNIFKSFQK